MKKKFLFAAAICGLFAAAVSCTEPGDDTPDVVNTLELANPLDADIILEPTDAESFTVAIKTTLTKEQISVKEKNGETWCDATVESATAIKVTPGANPSEEDLKAEFVISGPDGVDPVSFNVTRRGTSVEPAIELIGDGIVAGEWSYEPLVLSHKAQALTITVKTNSSKWYFGDNNMVVDEDEPEKPIVWYSADKTFGRNGESITISFTENSTSEEKMTSLLFDVEELGENAMMGLASITVTQLAKPATSVKVTVNMTEEVTGTSYKVDFAKDDAGSAAQFDFDLEKDGSIDIKFVKAGTNEVITDDNFWVNLTAVYGYSFIPTKNDTGAERKVDAIITPAGSDTELFRFNIVQAGN